MSTSASRAARAASVAGRPHASKSSARSTSKTPPTDTRPYGGNDVKAASALREAVAHAQYQAEAKWTIESPTQRIEALRVHAATASTVADAYRQASSYGTFHLKSPLAEPAAKAPPSEQSNSDATRALRRAGLAAVSRYEQNALSFFGTLRNAQNAWERDSATKQQSLEYARLARKDALDAWAAFARAVGIKGRAPLEVRAPVRVGRGPSLGRRITKAAKAVGEAARHPVNAISDVLGPV